MIQHLLGATPATIEFIGDFPEDRMNLAIKFNNSEIKDIISFLFSTINALYGLTVTKKVDERTVYSISIADEKKVEDIASKKSNVLTSVSYEGNNWVGSNVNMPILINFLESELGVIFKDKTGIQNSINVQFDKTDIEKAVLSLESLGFTINEATDDVTITIVEKGR